MGTGSCESLSWSRTGFSKGEMDNLVDLLVGAIELRIVYPSFSVDVDVGAMLIVVLDMAVVAWCAAISQRADKKTIDLRRL